MSSSRNSQPNDETPILHIDAATFQVEVTASVTAALAHFSASNANKNGNGVDSSNCCNNSGNQLKIVVTNPQGHKSEYRKRKRQDKNERKRSQILAMQQ